MLNVPEPVLTALRTYMAKNRYHVAKEFSKSTTGVIFLISSQHSPAKEVRRADRLATICARRKGKLRRRYPISLKRAREIWDKYTRELSPRLLTISNEGQIVAMKFLMDINGDKS